MLARIAADLVVMVHVLFVVYVVAGALLVLRWPATAWLHLPAAAWGALIELTGWICPLTPLEIRLRAQGGEAGYSGGFIEHYVLPVLYPDGLTAGTQRALGGLVIALNLGLYALVVRRLRRGARPTG